jgi:hypothetical protein
LYLKYLESIPSPTVSNPPPSNPKNPEENIVSLY